MKKIGMLLLTSAILLMVFCGCAVEENPTLLVGSMLPPDAPEPTPSPTPSPGDGYEGDGYAGGDSGSGIASFDSGNNSGSIVSPLPDPTKGKATTSSSNVSILEGENLHPSDKNLENALEEIKRELKEEKTYSQFSFLIVSSADTQNGSTVKVKLNDTYKNKIAYLYFMDTEGTLQKQYKNKDSLAYSVILDEKNFPNRELTLNFVGKAGSIICCFGAN